MSLLQKCQPSDQAFGPSQSLTNLILLLRTLGLEKAHSAMTQAKSRMNERKRDLGGQIENDAPK